MLLYPLRLHQCLLNMSECFILLNLYVYYATSKYCCPISWVCLTSPINLHISWRLSSCVLLHYHLSLLDWQQTSCHSTANCVYHLAFSNNLFLPLVPSVPCWFHSGVTQKFGGSTDSCSFLVIIKLYLHWTQQYLISNFYVPSTVLATINGMKEIHDPAMPLNKLIIVIRK